MIMWLIGYMGCGKSTVLSKLREGGSWPTLDTDQRIETDLGMSIGSIFTKHGEHYFRIIERQLCLMSSTQASDLIIATGGGIPVHSFSVDEMKQVGKVIYLRVPIDEMWRRIQSDDTIRPLAEDRQAFFDRFEDRKACYETADIVLSGFEQWNARQWDDFIKQEILNG